MTLTVRHPASPPLGGGSVLPRDHRAGREQGLVRPDQWLGRTALKAPLVARTKAPASHGIAAGDAKAATPAAVTGGGRPEIRKILVLNSGSSTIKFGVLDRDGTAAVSGTVDKIGKPDSKLKIRVAGVEKVITKPVADHGEGLRLIVESLLDKTIGGLDPSEIGAVGHRVVHGGKTFKRSVVIDDEVEKAIEASSSLAPLHNPHNLLGIREAKKLLPGVPQVAVFDTAFHATLPPVAARYAIPSAWGDEIRRYGFHGISVEHSVNQASKMLDLPKEKLNLIVCHLGNGASITAVKEGKSIDTTMGFTPLEGIVMGTRGGVSDPGIVLYLAKEKGMTPEQISKGLNEQGGLLALSEQSNDVRTLLEAREKGDEKAAFALEKYTYEVAKQIGAFTAALMGEVTGIVFTGGVGENATALRSEIMQRMRGLGFHLDAEKNQKVGREDADISEKGHPAILVIHADEESVIAAHALKLAEPRSRDSTAAK